MMRIVRSKGVFRVGLVAFVLSALVQIPGRMHPEFHPDLMDGLRGLFLGIFLGAMAVTIWRNNRPPSRDPYCRS